MNAEQQKVKIHLHPEDLTLIKTSYGEQAIEDNHWQLIPEPTLERGGCEVKTTLSSLDMTLKTRVKETLDSFCIIVVSNFLLACNVCERYFIKRTLISIPTTY